MDKKGLIGLCKNRLRYADKTYWILFGALMIVSIIALFSASSSLAFKQDSALEPVMKHILFLALGAGQPLWCNCFRANGCAYSAT